MKWFALLGLLLFLGLAVAPTITASSDDDIEYYITAGRFRERWGNIGLGYCVLVKNNGENNIRGTWFVNQTMLSGDKYIHFRMNFTLAPGFEIGEKAFRLYPLLFTTKTDITLKVENITASKSGYQIGPLCILMD